MLMWLDRLIKKGFEVYRRYLESDREIACGYALQFAGTWYSWGGDDPTGFDCSGFAVEFLKAAGKIKRNADFTAESLYNMFQPVMTPTRGCLVFYENIHKKIVHVEIMLNERIAIGASGGGSKTLTKADAIRDNAFIKIRDHRSRDKIAGYVDPFYVRT
ncbi:MAG: C40 family peptidase [bacterium]|nr:C40 family peptidase [bacterium]